NHPTTAENRRHRQPRENNLVVTNKGPLEEMSDASMKKRVGEPDERTEVQLRKGDTLWNLAEEKYEGAHPIDAIYEENNLTPTSQKHGEQTVLIDPIYYAGSTYILPARSEISQLQKSFWLRVDGRTLKERVGSADQSTYVTLRWDEKLSDLSSAKYDGRQASEAIFEANDLKPTLTSSNGEKQVAEPIYYAGRSYRLPAESEIADLTKAWKRRINS
ncbi:MAG TPA: hypothetical protein V6C72_03955, partial [Chroococcales cyanobacterium]